jgi:tetratricopeptide (TPR) repeat protein
MNKFGVKVRFMWACVCTTIRAATVAIGASGCSKSAADLNKSAAQEYELGDYDGAIADCDEAIRLNPCFADVYYQCGLAYTHKGDLDRAFREFTDAIRLKPNDAEAFHSRGNARAAKGELKKAVALDPSATDLLNDLSWLLATCPDANHRDGQRAVELATKACQLTEWKSWPLIDTLAAAYAEVVDHIVPHRADRKLFWDQSNWQALCRMHHSKKTATRDGGFGNRQGVSPLDLPGPACVYRWRPAAFAPPGFRIEGSDPEEVNDG